MQSLRSGKNSAMAYTWMELGQLREQDSQRALDGLERKMAMSLIQFASSDLEEAEEKQT